MLCQDCDKRESCTTLCDEAERYVNADHVTHRELYRPLWILDTMPSENWFEAIAPNVPLTKRERQILRLFAFGLTRKDICYVLEIKPNNLEVHISNLRKKAARS